MAKIDEFMDTVLRGLEAVKLPRREVTEDDVAAAARELVKRGYMPFNREVFPRIATWYALRQGGGGLSKGLFLCGTVGTGKTYLLKCLGKKIVSMSRMVELWHDNKGRSGGFWYDTFGVYDNDVESGGEYVFDDVGQEPVVVSFGEKLELFSHLVPRVYGAYERHGAVPYITTNLNRDAFLARYGARTVDRIAEMCDVIEFKGRSLRGI